MRKDITEGADFDQMPLVGYGRILGSHYSLLREWYCTIRVFRWRCFIACGRYDFHSRSLRTWVKREPVLASG